MVHNDINKNRLTEKHNGLKSEWTSNNIAPKYIKENLTQPK